MLRGYINIDTIEKPDLNCDITKLPYPEGFADEILCVHTFEHLFPHDAKDILKHWCGILKVGGKLIMEMPNLQKVLEFFKNKDAPLSHTMFALYGGVWSGRIEDTHKWCWDFATLKPIMEQAGFSDVTEKPALYHYPERDFRIVGVK